MKTLITKLFGAALILGATHSFANPNLYTVTNIPADSSLTLRAWPSLISQPLANIPANVDIIEATGQSILLDTIYWIQVGYDNKVGWVEASYLTQAQEAILPVTTKQEETKETVNTAELFSYGATPQEPTPETPALNNNQYPWSAEADTIFDDPNPGRSKEKEESIITQNTQPPTNNAEPGETTTTSSTGASTSEATASTEPQPVVLTIIDDPDGSEDPGTNRYETIETVATTDFIEK